MAWRCRGFRFAGVGCGIKPSGTADLGMIASDGLANAAAVFTRNRLPAAPVVLSKRGLKRTGGRVSGVVVNSGNANACTGEEGARDAIDMRNRMADRVSSVRSHVLVASTGVIGVPLPMDRISAGVDAAAASLSPSGFDNFSRAILTTDRGPKQSRRRVSMRRGVATLIGCTKGAGMIAPNMATTLTFVTTDVSASPPVLHNLLVSACEQTFNAITVDGDTSTNDMILIMASGASSASLRSRKDESAFSDALTDLLAELATKLMRDGEGVNHVAKVIVSGAKDQRTAQRIARSVANSPLVKTAIAGRDPNWGRILAAAGNAGVPLVGSAIGLSIGRVAVVRKGVRVRDWERAEKAAAKVMSRAEYSITLDLGRGAASAHYLACDLSHEYVTINADYRT